MPKEELWLTTLDNPYDPFEENETWKSFDEEKKYFTANYIARIANVSDELGDEAYQEAINEAVKEIYEMNLTGNYRIVSRKVRKDE